MKRFNSNGSLKASKRSKEDKTADPCPEDEETWLDLISDDDDDVEGVLPIEHHIEGVLPQPSTSSLKPVQYGGRDQEWEELKKQNEEKRQNDKRPKLKYTITFTENDKHYETFHMMRYLRKVKVQIQLPSVDTDDPTDEDLLRVQANIRSLATQIDRLYAQLVNEVTNKYDPDDYYLVIIKNEHLTPPIIIGFKKIRTFDRTEFTNQILGITQSRTDFLLKAFNILIYISKTPTGRGYGRPSAKTRAPKDAGESSFSKRSVITIKNDATDSDCGYRALWVALTYYEEKLNKYPNLQQWSKESDVEKKTEMQIMFKRWGEISGRGNNSDKFQKIGAENHCFDANNWHHTDKCNKPHSDLHYVHSLRGIERHRITEEIKNCEHYKVIFDVNQPFGSDPQHFECMQQYMNLKDYVLVIVDAHKPSNILFKNQTVLYEDDKPIFLEYNSQQRHYNWIKDVAAYMETPFVCKYCCKGHYEKAHTCDGRCNVCNSPYICTANKEDLQKCDVCGKVCRGENCLKQHKENNLCRIREHCTKCEVDYAPIKSKPHICNQFNCKYCGEVWVQHPHYCMMKPLDLQKLMNEDEVNKIVVCFDIESCAILEEDSQKENHAPNLLISSVSCNYCWNPELKQKNLTSCWKCNIDGCEKCTIDGIQVFNACPICGGSDFEFQGYECVKDFCDYLYKVLAVKAAEKEMQIIVFAHNSKGYDGHFILKDLFSRRFVDQPQIIMSGLKVLKIAINNISFIDSLSFFQQSLSALPKSFGFADIVEKGFFPHAANKPAFYEYVGQIPDISLFETGFMKESAAKECKQWVEEYRKSGRIWNFKEELLKYCRSDVKILTMAVMEFRKLFQSITQLDPITRSFTLASVALEQFRSSVLQKDQIGITPIKGYITNRSQSMMANIWLDWQEMELQTPIIREQKIGPYYADGYIFEEKHVFEFFGCYFHGCRVCFPDTAERHEKRDNLSKSFYQLEIDTDKKIRYYQSKGYKLSIIWEHEYKALCSSNERLKDFYQDRFPHYKSIKKYGHLQIRDAFFGGRTNNLFFNSSCDEEGDQIKYVDFCSLYPSVLVDNFYPMGHPDVITSFTSTNIEAYFGFIKCKVQTPEGLYIPVLPVRDEGKLVFPLCAACVSERCSECTHADKQRQLVGTWFSEELKLALTKGYKIIKIYEVFDFKQRSSELFKPYIQKWLKIKTEASGWPSNCTSMSDRAAFIEEFEEREGVDLDPDNMEPNPGKRFIAKLMLNSLWGKLAQRPNQGQTKVISDYMEFRSTITNGDLTMKGMIEVSDDTLLVHYKYTEDEYAKPGNTNIAIASMVTAYARMKLYKEMDRIESSSQGRVLYFDTDSIIYKHNINKPWYCPPTGNFLGEMTDEVEKDFKTGAYICNFAAGGPKNYSYIVKDCQMKVHIKTKIKGMNICECLAKVLDFNLINEFANEFRVNNRQLTKEVPQLQFRTDPLHNVFTTKFNKKYRVVSDKRVVLSDNYNIQTVPFGYVRIQ